MAKNIRKAKVTPETQAESVKLKDIWEAKNDRPSQAIFGETFQIGSQSAVTSFLNGHTPLSLKAAKGFAAGLGCRISDFSPRLAALETAWPFELVDRELYDSLSPALQHRAQLRMNDEVQLILEEQTLKANGTHS